MNDSPAPTSLERAEKLQGMGCKRKRVEDVRFTQGRGNYIDDLKLPGMLHGDFHRSSHGHARIVKIDTSKAKAVPGVIAVLTAEDLKGVNLAWMPTLAGDVQMVLADGKVLFQNQEIAFVVATDRYVAADAADLVEVEYEALPVVVDPFKAMDQDAPVLREDIKDKKDGAHGPRKHANHIFNWQVGDKDLTDAAFLKAEVTTKDLLSYQRVHPCPLETCQAVVSFNKILGELTIYGTFQAPHVIRTVVALIAGLPEHKNSCDLARHRRRFRQQGRRLSGLYLRRGRLDRDRPAGQMGRGSHREPLHHLVRPRLPHDDRDRGDARGPGVGAARAYPRRPRGVRRLRRSFEMAGRLLQHRHRVLRLPGRAPFGRRRLHQQGARRRRLSLLVPRHRGRLRDRARHGHHGAEAGSGPGRLPDEELHQARAVSLSVRARLGIRFRRLSRRHAEGARRDRLSQPTRGAEGAAGGVQAGRDARTDGDRRFLLHRDRRRRPIEELRHPRHRDVRLGGD